jgi:hypothetical protein
MLMVIIMKINTNNTFVNNTTSRLTHRVYQDRFFMQKTTSHRYERRKVREYLRQADSAAGDN